MGLPSKKQLHKHKRGARKALDTLDAMEKTEGRVLSEPDVEKLIETKKAKKPQSVVKKKKGVEATAKIDRKSKSVDGDLPAHAAGSEIAESNQGTDKGEVKSIEADSKPSKNGRDAVLSLEPQEKTIVLENPKEQPVNHLNGEAENNSRDPSQHPSFTLDQAMAETVDTQKPVTPAQSDLAMGNPQKDESMDQINSDDDDEDLEDTQKDKFLTFQIGNESFGFSIRYVTEIIVIHKITEVPDTPAFVKGVINLRGKVIPVIDVRQRFGLELKEYDERTCIVVVDYAETAVGLIVDTVNEVLDIPADHIDPPPRKHGDAGAGYIQGMGKVGKKVNILLDLEKVLFVEELLAKQRVLQET